MRGQVALREKRGEEWRRPAQTAVAGALAYIGINWGISIYAATWVYETETIASPVPFAFWERDVFVGGSGEWFIEKDEEEILRAVTNGEVRDAIVLRPSLVPLSSRTCKWPDLVRVRNTNSQLNAFLFWSRAPFAERAPDGSVLIRDARFYDPRTRDRFTVALPDVKCEPLP